MKKDAIFRSEYKPIIIGSKSNTIPLIGALETNNIEEKKRAQIKYAIRLMLKGSTLSIHYNGKQYKLRKIRKNEGSPVLVEPIIKACKSSPSSWKAMTRALLKGNSYWEDKALEKAMDNSSNFGIYISNLGLKNELGDLFYEVAPTELGFRFRIAVPQEEWDELDQKIKQNLVNMISKIGDKKASLSQS